MAGDICGRDALLAWFSELKSMGFWLNEHDVMGSDEHVCALSTMGHGVMASMSRRES
jgi:hypothetical protein